MGVGGQRHAPAALPPGKGPGTHCVGGWMGHRAGLDGCGKSGLPTGIRSPDLPACSESLYRLRYPGPWAAIRKYRGFIPATVREVCLNVTTERYPVSRNVACYTHVCVRQRTALPYYSVRIESFYSRKLPTHFPEHILAVKRRMTV